MSITLQERLANPTTPWMLAQKLLSHELRVAMPATVQSFDAETQTVVVQPAIREQMRNKQQVVVPTTLPLISYVPIVIPTAGGYALTLPIQAGDEGLLVVADNCIDAWWQSGGVQNQIDLRRHDLSDAFFIVGCYNQTRKISSYSTSTVQIRTDVGDTVVEVGNGEITIKAATVTVQAEQVNVTGSEKVTISGNNQTVIDDVTFLQHTHSGVTAGGGVTGPVVP
ncbi:MAG TPA: Gp138 family membrane-puncturing spike protein [Acidobacteriaceae bacterium]|jgi:hypothetical protein